MQKVKKRLKSMNVIVLLFIIMMLLSASSPLAYNAKAVSHYQIKMGVSGATPPDGQGVYESCGPGHGTICLNRLRQIANGGFNLVVNYDQFYGTIQQELEYAKLASSLHIKIIWGMSAPDFWNGSNLLQHFNDFAATCNCSDNKGFISYAVNIIKGLPSTWGYYIGDEVSTSDHNKMKSFADLVKQLDPLHPRLFIGSGENTNDGSNLAPFTDSAEVIGADFYPVGSARSMMDIGTVARTVQSISDHYQKQSAVVIQSFSWSQYPSESWRCQPFPNCATFPTVSQMLQMRTLVLQNSHPQLILWYSFFDVMRSKNPNVQWNNLIQVTMQRNLTQFR